MTHEINLDHVEVIDANELGLVHMQNVPKETMPEGIVFDGIHCIDCGFEIEAQRLVVVANTCRCGECKMWYDKDQQRKLLNGNPNYEEE